GQRNRHRDSLSGREPSTAGDDENVFGFATAAENRRSGATNSFAADLWGFTVGGRRFCVRRDFGILWQVRRGESARRRKMTTPELSVVIPCHNEAENLRALLLAIHAALDPLGLNFEVVITDDRSSDGSWRVLQELSASDPCLRAQRFQFNCGESAASWAGMQIAKGRYIATLDADLQNDPKD